MIKWWDNTVCTRNAYWSWQNQRSLFRRQSGAAQNSCHFTSTGTSSRSSAISSSTWWGRRKKTRLKKHIAQNEWRSGRSDRRIHTTRRIQIFIKRALSLLEYFSIPGCLVSQYNKLSYNSGTLDADTMPEAKHTLSMTLRWTKDKKQASNKP